MSGPIILLFAVLLLAYAVAAGSDPFAVPAAEVDEGGKPSSRFSEGGGHKGCHVNFEPMLLVAVVSDVSTPPNRSELKGRVSKCIN